MFGYTAVQQNYRMSANDPQIQMAEDTAAAWNQGQSPQSLVPKTQVDAVKSLAPFVILVDKNDQIIGSNMNFNGSPSLPPKGVFGDASRKGELRFTWQTEGGNRYATIVEPVNNGYVVVARSLHEVENREQQLTAMAALTLFGVFIVLVIAYAVMR